MSFELSKCVVRPLRHSDATSLARHGNNINVSLNINGLPYPMTIESTQEWLRTRVDQPSRFIYAIEVNGEPIGVIGLVVQPEPKNHSAEIGYWLGQDHWGKGIATEVVKHVTQHGFADLKLRRIYGLVFEWNSASMRVLEKCGYTREGVLKNNVRCLKRDGQIIDEVLYAITPQTDVTAASDDKGIVLTTTDRFHEQTGDAKAVLEGLIAYNRQHIGEPHPRKLAVFAKDERHQLVGGLLGFTSWQWLYVDKMWIAEAHRREGLGRRILTEAESEAKRRGCKHVHLRTGESQAPAFYQKLGYSPFGVLDEFANGKALYFMKKDL